MVIMETQNKITMRILIISTIVVLAIGSSFAFLLARKAINLGKTEDMETSLATAKDLKLSFSDCLDGEECNSITQDLGLGESAIKEFKIENNSTYNLKYVLYFQELFNTFKNDELVYKIENIDTDEVVIDENPIPYRESLDFNIPITKEISIKKNETHKYRMTIKFKNMPYDQSENMDAEYRFVLGFSESKVEKLIGLNEYARLYTPDFSKTSETDEGVYSIEYDNTHAYFYRGTVEDNYFKLGETLYRIARINSDGSLRLAYNGTLDNILKDNIDSTLDSWYQQNIVLPNLESFVVENEYCSDPVDELNTPTLSCNNIQNKKVGLLSVQDVVMAGGNTVQNEKYYLHMGKPYWLNNEYLVDTDGSIKATSDVTSSGVVPVVNIGHEFVESIKGTGTLEDPYTI